ncbi:MAG: hypothetical protein ACREMO_12645 [Gemmatimonadales bacterium]
MTDATDPKRQMLRHTLATLAYRAGKTLHGAPQDFAGFQADPGTRTPAQILAHVGDLLDWALWLCQGEHRWSDSRPLPWAAEVSRFFAALRRLEDYLASGSALGATPEKLFQGPIADALTHAGQLALLRRMAGAPVRAENYFKAEIQAGRVGPEQSAKRVEFD